MHFPASSPAFLQQYKPFLVRSFARVYELGSFRLLPKRNAPELGRGVFYRCEGLVVPLAAVRGGESVAGRDGHRPGTREDNARTFGQQIVELREVAAGRGSFRPVPIAHLLPAHSTEGTRASGRLPELRPPLQLLLLPQRQVHSLAQLEGKVVRSQHRPGSEGATGHSSVLFGSRGGLDAVDH